MVRCPRCSGVPLHEMPLPAFLSGAQISFVASGGTNSASRLQHPAFIQQPLQREVLQSELPLIQKASVMETYTCLHVLWTFHIP